MKRGAVLREAARLVAQDACGYSCVAIWTVLITSPPAVREAVMNAYSRMIAPAGNPSVATWDFGHTHVPAAREHRVMALLMVAAYFDEVDARRKRRSPR